MDREAKLKALLWASRRGMLELDVILTPYIDAEFQNMSEANIKHFEDYLTQDDPDLYAWLMGFETPNSEYLELTNHIKAFINKRIK